MAFEPCNVIYKHDLNFLVFEALCSYKACSYITIRVFNVCLSNNSFVIFWPLCLDVQEFLLKGSLQQIYIKNV